MTVTAAKGFRAGAAAAGIKASGALDVAVVVNDGAPHLRAAAAVFTPNRFAAAPVEWSRAALDQCTPMAVVLNSGGANACTGARGASDAAKTAAHAANLLDPNAQAEQVLVCSTGLIGEFLPMERLLGGVRDAIGRLSAEEGEAAARAIMTTDTRPKMATASGAGGLYTVGGMAKGAGMLAPALATMLVVVTTDAVVPGEMLRGALDVAADRTFNRIDSDGCQSTNDTVIVMASGASGHQVEPGEFTETLTAVCADLARGLIADAEGAEHDIAITVAGAPSEAAALLVARAVARSNLVKTAIYGRDPNWGRILSEVGTIPYAVVPFDPAAVDLAVNAVMLVRSGAPDADRSLVDLTGRDVVIHLDLHAGPAEATVLTNDLTHAYVEENSAYST